jgi:hypothetical protein
VRVVMAMTVEQVRSIYSRYKKLVNPGMHATAFAITFDQLCFMFSVISMKELAKLQIDALQSGFGGAKPPDTFSGEPPRPPPYAQYLEGVSPLRHPEHPLHHLMALGSNNPQSGTWTSSSDRARSGRDELLPPDENNTRR